MSRFGRNKENGTGSAPSRRGVMCQMMCFKSAGESPNQVAEPNTRPGITPGRSRASTPDRAIQLTKIEAERAEFGLKVLYDCEAAEVDIVTVHGLNGHRERTFTANNGVCWLNSLLPEKIRKMRVISYGYDARTHSSSPLSREHLHDHAEQLVEKLTRKRDVTKTTHRPIIFIAHSLGGIVVKSALILSASFNASHRESQKAISLSTHGILFMGTPHAGGGGVSWGKLALNLASVIKHKKLEYLDVLERNSQWLEQQQVQYNSISSRFDTKFFYEIYETPLPGGETLMIVPKHSACVAGARDAAVIGVSSDHSNMVKFKSDKDEGFIAVAESLEMMIREATQTVNSNWQEWEAIRAIAEAQKISYSIPMSLPFRRNENFTGRQEELLRIDEALHGGRSSVSDQRVLVLYGLGGIGKTQLATQYAYAYENSYTSVWWVNANTTATLSQDFFKIAQSLVTYYAQARASIGQTPDYSWIATMLGMSPNLIDHAGILTASTDIGPVVAAVKAWMANKDNQKWLLIVDNYDDLDVQIADYLPHSSGSVIITSRAQDSRRLGTGFEIEGVQLEDGIEILRKSAGTNIEEFSKERTDAIDIVQKLGALPLALDQAGAYINSMQITYSQYLPRFNSQFAIIGGRRPTNSVWQYREDTICTTWEISFAALGPGAQQLLLLCGFLDNEDIWEGLLSAERLRTELGIDSVDDAIREIFSLSLARRKNATDSLWIHSVVHRWSRERLDDVEKEAKTSIGISMISAALPHIEDREDSHNLESERRLMPHVKMCSSLVREGYLDCMAAEINKIEEVETLGITLRCHGEFGLAEEIGEWVLAGKENALGMNHPNTLAAVYEMAVVFRHQGRYDDALEYCVRAVVGSEVALGKDHSTTLNAVHNMALVFKAQGKYDDALQLYRRVLAGQLETVGLDHPATLTTLHNMGVVFKNQGRYDDALECYRQVLAGQEKSLEIDHPSTLNTIHNMSAAFNHQGRYDQALDCCRRALAGKEKSLGTSHPSTLNTVHNMAGILKSQGKYDDALEWYKRALEGQEKTLGNNHPTTLNTLNSMAVVFENQKEFDDALEWYGRALTGQEKALGKDHPMTLNTVQNMASVLRNLGRYEDALEWYGRALPGLEKALGPNHPHTIDTRQNFMALRQRLKWRARIPGMRKSKRTVSG